MADSNSSTYSLSRMYDRITSEMPYFDYDGFVDQLLVLLTDRKVVLELCSGTGNLASKMVARGLRVIGLDADQAMLAYCQQKYGDLDGLELVHGDATGFNPFDDVEAVVIHSGHIIFNRRVDGGIFLNTASEESALKTFRAVAAQLQVGGLLIMNVEVWDNQHFNYPDGAFYDRFIHEDTEEYGTRIHTFFDPHAKVKNPADRLTREVKVREPKMPLTQVNILLAELGLLPYEQTGLDVLVWIKGE